MGDRKSEGGPYPAAICLSQTLNAMDLGRGVVGVRRIGANQDRANAPGIARLSPERVAIGIGVPLNSRSTNAAVNGCRCRHPLPRRELPGRGTDRAGHWRMAPGRYSGLLQVFFY